MFSIDFLLDTHFTLTYLLPIAMFKNKTQNKLDCVNDWKVDI